MEVEHNFEIEEERVLVIPKVEDALNESDNIISFESLKQMEISNVEVGYDDSDHLIVKEEPCLATDNSQNADSNSEEDDDDDDDDVDSDESVVTR